MLFFLFYKQVLTSLDVFKDKLDKHWEHLKLCTNFTNEGVEG